MSDALISVDGGRFEPGSLVVESGGRLVSWRGDVQAHHEPGRDVRIVAISVGAVLFGQAMLTKVGMPPLGSDEKPVSEFQGNGELRRADIAALTELLFRGSPVE